METHIDDEGFVTDVTGSLVTPDGSQCFAAGCNKTPGNIGNKTPHHLRV